MPTQPMVEVRIDERQYAAALKRISKYEGRELQRRARQAYLEGARLLRGPLRAAAPIGPTRHLVKSIKASENRRRANEMAVATVGTTHRIAPHRYLVARGHRIVSHQPTHADSGKRSKANPFVDEVYRRYGSEVQSFITRQVLAIGASTGIVSSFRSLGG